MTNDEYYQIDICHYFDADSDEDALKKVKKILEDTGIPAEDVHLKRFRKNTLGDFGTFIGLEDEEE